MVSATQPRTARDPGSGAAGGDAVPLRVLHVFRAPAGGLFRHVADLARGQAAAGHDVGILCASESDCPQAEERLAALAPVMTLGMRRMRIPRLPHPRDAMTVGTVRTLVAETGIDIVHGHGAKGGAMARLGTPPGGRAKAIYTPHGGSLHYTMGTPAGAAFLMAERLLKSRTDAFIFESAFAREAFAMKAGVARALSAVVYNGVGEADFRPLPARRREYDIAFVGEMRLLKGVDVLLGAMARLRQQGRTVSAILAGDGPDAAYFRDLACEMGLAPQVTFPGTRPVREVLASARAMAVPSLAESLPYVVLEAAAAGVPLVATRTGGIPEILGTAAGRLVPPGDAAALADALERTLDAPAAAASEASALRADVARRFSMTQMIAGVEAVYRHVLADVPLPAPLPAAAAHTAHGA